MQAFVINLQNRKDKLMEFQKNPFPFQVKRVDAVVDHPADNGCAKSHIKVLNMIKEFPTAVFEDDCVLLRDWSDVEYAMSQLPDDWDALWLGATLHTPLRRYSENLYRMRQGHTLHAVIYNSASMIEYVLKNFDNHAWIGNKHIIDVFYAYVVQPAFNCFTVSPIAASQRAGLSDITGKEVNYYQEIIDSYNKFAK